MNAIAGDMSLLVHLPERAKLLRRGVMARVPRPASILPAHSSQARLTSLQCASVCVLGACNCHLFLYRLAELCSLGFAHGPHVPCVRRDSIAGVTSTAR